MSEEVQKLDIKKLLKSVVAYKASDLHLVSHAEPQIRIDGRLVPLNLPQLDGDMITDMAYALLTEKQKKDFVEVCRAAAMGQAIEAKANEAFIEEQDNRGGFLVSPEIAAAILRIAASVGTVISQASHWTMTKDELAIPNYTGSFLTGSFIGASSSMRSARRI